MRLVKSERSLYVGTVTICLCSVISVGVVFSNDALLSGCRQQPVVWQQPGLFGNSVGAPLTNKSIKCSWVLVVHAFNPSTQKVEVGGEVNLLSLSPDQSTEKVLGQ